MIGKTGRSPAAVSTSPLVQILHFVYVNLDKIDVFGVDISCSSSTGNNNECEMFICECDRKAAECFGRSEWNPEHEHLPSENCQ